MSDTSADRLRGLLGPAGAELTCDECFEHLDRYVELEHSGADADAAVPGMRAHLEGCPACGEDRDSLRALLAAEHGPTRP
ncbi:MAG: hypothetical protein QOG77_3149 [Solirubrobacteraceae bacterium]|nr:hypothetical protein [Solirubrobacteraceae bacterium]